MKRFIVLTAALLLPLLSFANCPSIKSLSKGRLIAVDDQTESTYNLMGQLIDINNSLSRYWTLRASDVKASDQTQAMMLVNQALTHGLVTQLDNAPKYDEWGTARCSYILTSTEDFPQKMKLVASSDVGSI